MCPALNSTSSLRSCPVMIISFLLLLPLSLWCSEIPLPCYSGPIFLSWPLAVIRSFRPNWCVMAFAFLLLFTQSSWRTTTDADDNKTKRRFPSSLFFMSSPISFPKIPIPVGNAEHHHAKAQSCVRVLYTHPSRRKRKKKLLPYFYSFNRTKEDDPRRNGAWAYLVRCDERGTNTSNTRDHRGVWW